MFTYSPAQEAQRIFPARFNMDKETDKSKVRMYSTIMVTHVLTSHILFTSLSALSMTQLLGYKLSLLENVDPNPDNFVSAGIISTRSVLVGCLLRLEPNLQTKVCAVH